MGQNIPKDQWDSFHKGYNKSLQKGTLITVIVAVDIFVTKGWLSRFVMGSQLLGAFEHNRASSADTRFYQSQREKESLSNAFIAYGVGKLIGGFVKTTTATKEIEYIFTKKDYNTLVFDPDKAKITVDAIQELKVALSAEFQVGSITARAAKNTGADFVTTKGLIDIKNAKKFIDAANGTQKEFSKLVGTIKANKDVKYVIDFKNSNVTNEKFDAILKKFFDAGVDKSQIIKTSNGSVETTKIKTF